VKPLSALTQFVLASFVVALVPSGEMLIRVCAGLFE
jgi:hypothetical protein